MNIEEHKGEDYGSLRLLSLETHPVNCLVYILLVSDTLMGQTLPSTWSIPLIAFRAATVPN